MIVILHLGKKLLCSFCCWCFVWWWQARDDVRLVFCVMMTDTLLSGVFLFYFMISEMHWWVLIFKKSCNWLSPFKLSVFLKNKSHPYLAHQRCDTRGVMNQTRVPCKNQENRPNFIKKKSRKSGKWPP